MSISWFRDLVICVAGIVAAGVLIFIAVLAYSIYRRTKTILDSMEARATAMRELTSYVGDELIKPIIQVVALVQGVRKGVEVVGRFCKKQKGG